MNKRSLVSVLIILIAAAGITFFNLPNTVQTQILPGTPQAILDSAVNLGLDLQGGAQLDYKIDLTDVAEEDRKTVVDGILNVINRRVNSLGVAEPNIYTSDYGSEKHVIVELAGIKDLEEAKEIVGKTIQLEFKEQRETSEPDQVLIDEARQDAQAIMDRVNAGENFKAIAEEAYKAEPTRVFFGEATEFLFPDELAPTYKDLLLGLEVNKPHMVEALEESPRGIHIFEITQKQETERTISTPRSVETSHILISFAGAQGADASITRIEAEAQKLAQEVLDRLKQGGEGSDFAALAQQFSDDQDTKAQGGKQPTPVLEGEENYPKEYEDAAFAFTEPGQLSEVVKDPFGFHIIKADALHEAKTETKTEPQITYHDLFISAEPDPWQETALNGQHFKRADVQFNQVYQPYVAIQFDEEGALLFEELTRKNLGKPIAIFVGGELVSAPNVNTVITGGSATITGNFTIQEATALARDLNTGAIPAPITLAGQYTIGASLGQDALNKSMIAGVIGFILVSVFMILYYRLPGLLSVIALAIYTSILLFLIKIALPVPYALGISVVIFIVIVGAILKNKDSGPEKAIAGVLACFVLFFMSFILSTSVVLTLAGIAGVILSIGMAVDANILIFERIKEELRAGKSLRDAIEIGFDRAWDSIRDSNFSSLITCAILFYFGSSIIQGFAFNLAAGILVSMFTAITITKTFLIVTAKTRLGRSLWLFGGRFKPKKKRYFQIIQKRKFFYILSGILVLVTLLSIPIYGVRWGLDFTGGTSIELHFEDQTVTPDRIRESLSAATLTENEEAIDLSKAHIVQAEDNFMIKIPHITSETHDQLLVHLQQQLGTLEENRFSTVGPTVGESLQQKAVIAVLIASLMIVAYIAFAFRKVPKSIGSWRFGLTAIAALVHDLAIMIGLYVYLGNFANVEVDALFITALLTILGFSVHDTIVVFDRLREKLRYKKRDESFEDVANQAVNETMARSFNTSLSVILSLVALVIFGSEAIRPFVLSLLIGVISGTYSSIFVATPLLVDWQKARMKK